MCGIAGFVGAKLMRHDECAIVLNQMCNVIEHRGPDDQGMFVKSPVALGMRRLSIIDLAGGHQPMSGEDDSVTIVFNGEIYNFLLLKTSLESRGHRFKSNSDTEAIIHAYEEYGAACVNHLRGMFAFAIWDDKEKKLFIARDRVGKKPLYYTVTEQSTFVFASELKSLLEHPEVQRNVSVAALDAYFSLGYVPDPLSVFEHIHKLPPGHHLTWANGRVTTKSYWDLDYKLDETFRSEKDYLNELRELLTESVKIRLISDVPLGAFLSGGIDSSTIVALMARNMDQQVKTFSIGFHEDSYSELKYARLTAEKFSTDHHEFIVTPDICQVVDELAWYFDEPFADSSAIPTYVVSKLARQYVKVVLSGDGGDELFGGYTRYLVDQKRSRFSALPEFVRKGVMQPMSRQLPHRAWGRNFIHNISLNPIDRYFDSVSVFTDLNKESLYTEDFKNLLGKNNTGVAKFRELASRVKTGKQLDRLMYIDSKTYLPGDILTKVDRMSMAVSLEARAPLLDHKLIEFVTRLPSALKLHGGHQPKYILKRAVCDLVPTEILHRAKQGFGVPIQQWINHQLRGRIHETLLERRCVERGFTSERYVRQILHEHERGRRDHGTPIWALFMLELWYRAFIDSSSRASITQPTLAVVN